MVLPKKNNQIRTLTLRTLPVAHVFSLLSVVMLVCLMYACSSSTATGLKGKRPSSGEFLLEPLVEKRTTGWAHRGSGSE